MSTLNRYKKSNTEHISQPKLNSQSQMQKLAIDALRSSEDILPTDRSKIITQKYRQLQGSTNFSVDFLEYLIYELFNCVTQLQEDHSQYSKVQISEEYQILEEAVQKAEEEIRRHIRVQQQLKICVDSLEDKLEELEQRIASKEVQYQQLFDSLREMQQEKKSLIKKIVKLQQISNEHERSRSKNSNGKQNTTDLLSRKHILHSKSKHIIQKLNDKNQKSNHDNSTSNFAQGAIHINLSNHITVSKKNSYDQYIKRHPANHDVSVKELTRTVQMKVGDKKKAMKYRSQVCGSYEKKGDRSNSVAG